MEKWYELFLRMVIAIEAMSGCGSKATPQLTPDVPDKKEAEKEAPKAGGIDPYALPKRQRHTADERGAIADELDRLNIGWGIKDSTGKLLKMLLDSSRVEDAPAVEEEAAPAVEMETVGDDDLFGSDEAEEKPVTEEEVRRALIAHKNAQIKAGKDGSVTKGILQKFGANLGSVDVAEYGKLVAALKATK